jgi:hypothetical protein
MPHMTGIELATQMQIERPVIRVLLMSGMAAGVRPLNEGWRVLPKGSVASFRTEQEFAQ